MKNNIVKPITLFIGMFLVLYAVHTFALVRNRTSLNGLLDSATWSVTRNVSQSDDSLEIIPNQSTDSYTLTVQSNSEVDVTYSIIINNLPTGVEVDIDNSGNYRTANNGTIKINQVGTINYNDAVKTKNHILTFRANNEAIPIIQSIDIDVEFKQSL